MQNWIMSKVLSKSFLTTVVRYLLVVAGTYLSGAGYVEEETWQVVTGHIMQLVFILSGGTEATKDKAVFEGRAVDIAKLPATVREDLKTAVENKPSRSWLDQLFGK